VLANSEVPGVGRRPILREIEMPVARDRGVAPQRTEQNAQLGLKRKCYQECSMVNDGCQTISELNLIELIFHFFGQPKTEQPNDPHAQSKCYRCCQRALENRPDVFA